MKTHFAPFALSLGIALTLASGLAQSQTMSAPAQPVPSAASAYPVAPAAGLYEAFGEKEGIRSLMTDFVQRLRADARIGEQFKDTNLDNLAGKLSDQLCQLSGGPCTYKGADMKAAHGDMEVTRANFNALVEVLQTTMDTRGIPFARQNQMLALLAPMHRDVVTPR